MAIDTAAKRRSVSGILTGLAIVGVTMDATPDVAWRQSAGWGYQGIAAGAPVAAIAGVPTKRDGVFSYARKHDGLFAYSRKRPGVLA